MIFYCGADGSRTRILLSASEMLRQFSYSPKIVLSGGQLFTDLGPLREMSVQMLAA